jgi:hypothetical protein
VGLCHRKALRQLWVLIRFNVLFVLFPATFGRERLKGGNQCLTSSLMPGFALPQQASIGALALSKRLRKPVGSWLSDSKTSPFRMAVGGAYRGMIWLLAATARRC